MAHSKPLQRLEADIEELLDAIEAAEDPTEAYGQLKAALREYQSRNRDLREDWHRQRNTIARQATALADAEIDLMLGYQAPPQPESPLPPHVQSFPDAVAIEKAPECLFIELDDGSLLNLLHLSFLDARTRTIYLSNGIIRQMEDAAAFHRVRFHGRLYATGQGVRLFQREPEKPAQDKPIGNSTSLPNEHETR